MKLGDIIALAKQGYKPGDIKELIALADNESEVDEGEHQQEPKLPEQQGQQEQQGQIEQQEQQEDSSVGQYLETIAKLEEELKKLQQENVQKNIAPKHEKTIDEQIISMFDSLM